MKSVSYRLTLSKFRGGPVKKITLYVREYTVRIGEGENADKPLFQADGVILLDKLAHLRWGCLALLPEVDTY